jgi:putative ABC transport system permease protein
VDLFNDQGKYVERLSKNDMRALAEAPSLSKSTVLPQLEDRTDARVGDQEMRVRVVGTNEGALQFYQLELARGRFLTSGDRLESRHVAVIGAEVAKTLFPGGELGELHIGTERFRVVGVLGRKPTLNVGNQTWNNAVAIPDNTYMAWKGQSDIDTILVKTNDLRRLNASVAHAHETIRAILVGRHHSGATLNVEDATTKSGGEMGFLVALRILMVAVALLCMGVGGINIMNIMLVTVTERTREIGLRLALGARKRDIRRQFLFEAAAISGLGGLLGVGGGILFGWLISQGLGMWLGFWPYVIEPLAVIVAFVSALGTGIVFGWYPAHQAANLQPIECLRFE